MSEPLRVLLIEDNPGDARLLAEMLAELGTQGLDCDLAWTDTLAAGERQLGRAGVDVVLLDLGLPDSSGLRSLQRLLAHGPGQQPALLVLSGLGGDELERQALEAGAQDYLVKGEIDAPGLARAIRHALGRARARPAGADASTPALPAATAAPAPPGRNGFLAGISHELRTPLNGILGFASILLEDDTLSDRQRRQISMIHRSGEHLQTLINDILDMAKAEAGRLELNPRPFEVETLVAVVEAIARLKAAQKPDLALQVEIAPGLPKRLFGDEQRLRQVLLNLMDNAVKFTESGHVRLHLGPAGRTRVACEVEDTGVGLSDAQRERLFQPYAQVGDRAQRCQGTGLGLFISRQLVRLMGGELRVAPREGGGNRFAFEVDLAPVA
ncbi:ATP-binding protein [Aquabacterium sp.]|uniref:ATP-binding response regulator n=1 Tax=Aquabacterium sp. TaxID=1872578 RepID=UPI003784CFF2